MHELGIAQNLVGAAKGVLRQHPGYCLTSLTVKVGALRQIDPAMLSEGWKAATLGTSMQNVPLAVDCVPASGKCGRCGTSFRVEDLVFICPQCGCVEVETLTGTELVLQSADLDKVMEGS